MITYLLKSGLLLVVFYAVYKLLLENEKMLRFNRAYLLGSLVFSFVVPLQLFSFQPLFETGLSTIQLEGIVIRTRGAVLDEKYILKNLLDILMQVYVVVAIVLTFHFILNIISFFKKIRNNETRFVNGEKVVLIEEPALPHSFWNAIFINKKEFETGKIPSELIVHEKAHLEQRHTLDLLFVELLQIVFWFNPFLPLFKKAIKLNHEFLADEAVNKQFNSVSDYQNLLLDFASNKNTISLASTINYSITKKRLLMMTKRTSKNKAFLKKITILPVFMILIVFLCFKTVAQEPNIEMRTVTLNNVLEMNNPKKTDVLNEEKNNAVPEDKSQESMTEQSQKKSEDDSAIKSTDIMVNSIEKKPEFPGGITAFYKFIGANFKTPAEAAANKIEGKAYLEFMVEKDGSLSEFKILKDLGYGIGDEVIRVLKLSPTWSPGSENGKPVRVLYSLPVTIENNETPKKDEVIKATYNKVDFKPTIFGN